MRAIMKTSLMAAVLVFVISGCCYAQEPAAITDYSWHRDRQVAKKTDPDTHGPVRMVTNDNKYFQRKSRENQPVVGMDPNDGTEDGRSIAMQKGNA